MGSSPKAPTPPDPMLTAQKQGEMNKQTAIANYGLNATNQVTPYGALSYNQIGKWEDGTPRFEATTSLSPEQQGLLNQQNEFGKQSNQLAINQIGRLSGVLSSPFKLGNEATEARLMELGRSRLDPALAMRRSQLENRLANQGINRGTEAYQSAMDELSRGENDAYNQLLLTGRGLANQEQLTERNQPISEISALIGGGQVSQPNFIGTPQSNVQPVDYMGAVNNNFNAQTAQYNANQAKQGALYGALGGIAGTALGGWANGGFKGFKGF
jgi:hypothetical protein